MSDEDKYSLLRKIFRALGLSPEAVDELIKRVAELLFDRKGKPADQFPYHLRDDFLSAAEHSFYLVLNRAVGDWAVICPKVSLSDVSFAKASEYGQRLAYTNRIDRKHIDFLLCDPQTVRPLVGIELDDKSHRRKDRQERDRFVEEVFRAAKLPLVRISVQRTYNVDELGALLLQHARQGDAQAGVRQGSTERTVAETGIPACPKCGSPMVLRTAKRGSHPGTQFWGCPNYPRCRGVRQYESVSQSEE